MRIPAKMYKARPVEFTLLNTRPMSAERFDAIEDREKGLRRGLFDLADESGIPVRTCREPSRRAGVVILDMPNGNEVTGGLARREIFVDYRPQAGIRIAPHFYTTDEEVEHTVTQLREIISTQ